MGDWIIYEKSGQDGSVIVERSEFTGVYTYDGKRTAFINVQDME